MKLKSILALAVCASSLLALAATSTPKGFTDDLDAALKEAKTTGRYVYACFSGSDWCGWCMRLEREVFADKTMDFVGALKDDYLFVFIDSPRNKDLLSAAAKARNPKLTKQYDIHGFPTALILNGEGKTVAQTGYRAGGAKPYAGYLKLIRKYGDKTDARLKAAQKKYFGSLDEQANEALKPLRGDYTVEMLETSRAAMEKLVKTVNETAIAPDDAEFGALAKASQAANYQRFVDMMTRDIGKKKAAAEKKAQKK